MNTSLRLLHIVLIVFSLNISRALIAQDAQQNAEYKLAQNLLKDKNFELALEQFKHFVEKYGNSSDAIDARYSIAELQLQLQQFDEARVSFQNFAVNYHDHPKAAQAWWNVGECYERLGNVREAANSYERLKVFFPNNDATPGALFKASEKYRTLHDNENEKRVLKLLQHEYASAKEFPRVRMRMIMLSLEEGNASLAQTELLRLLKETNDIQIQAEATLLLGTLDRQIAKYDDAEKKFKNVAEQFSTTVFARQANVELGKLYAARRQFSDALKYFRRGANDTSSVGEEALYFQEKIFFEWGKYDSALVVAESFNEKFSQSEYSFAVQYIAGIAASRVKKYAEAKKYFLETMRTNNDSLKICALTAFAGAAEENGAFADAVVQWESIARICMDSINTPHALFNAAFILFSKLQNYPRAKLLFAEYAQEFAFHSFVDDALFYSAVCDDSLQNYNEAMRGYQGLKKNYPASAYTIMGEQRAEYIQHFLLKNRDAGLEKLAVLVGEINSGAQKGDVAFRLGEIYFNDVKNYHAAAEQFQISLKLQLAETKVPDALYFRAVALERAEEHDDARAAYKEFLQRFPLHRYAEKAAYNLFVLECNTSSVAEQIAHAESLLVQRPAMEHKGALIMQLAVLYERSGNIQKALEQYFYIAENILAGDAKEEALLRLGKLYRTNGVADSCALMWNTALQEIPSGKFTPQILFSLGNLLLSEKNVPSAIAAIDAFHLLREKYFYTEFAASAESLEAESYIAAHRNDEAVFVLNTILAEKKKDMLHRASDFPFFVQLGNLYTEEKFYKQSRSYYLQALALDHNSADAAQVFFSLGNIEKEERNNELATAYYRQAGALGASGIAQNNIAELLFDSGQYIEAMRMYEELQKTAGTEKEKKQFQLRVILCKLRSENLLGAKTLMDEFSTLYPKDSIARAEIELERARYFIRQSNLKIAEKILDSLIRKKINGEITAGAYYWRGKIYEANELPDSAKKQYRASLAAAKNSTVLPRVLLSLGNIAYNAEHYDSAIALYQKVLEYQNEAAEIIPMAMSNLIEAFQQIKLYDAALKATRDFIQAFPSDESIVSKRIAIGVLYTRLGYFEQAITHFRQLLDELGSATEAEIRYDIGEVYFYNKEYEQAILEFLKVPYLAGAKSRIDWTATALYMAGQSYEQLSKFEQAINMYQQIIDRPGIDANFKAAAEKEKKRVRNLLKKG
jgi:TolA-binding protein